MHLRYAEIKDLEAIVALEQENFEPKEQIANQVLAYYVESLPQTCLVMESDQQELVGYLLARPTTENRVTDNIFYQLEETEEEANYLAIASLSIAPNFKGQGVGTLLLAALKELAVIQGYRGVSLTCKDHLLRYYEMNGFEDCGVSDSQFGGQVWYDMYWETP
ncbi:GNAT family N-acetyltransferase [Streptococcus suis]|nr:GNAT family N-acetyltransferase [Streptococcus suis]